MKKLSSKFSSKPSYDLYIQLWYTLDVYLTLRIDSYIFFKYYNWDLLNISNIKLVEDFNIKIFHILKIIYEYDYKVFKVLLFLYWDLEYYLEDVDNIKNILIVNTDNLDFLSIKFNKDIKSYEKFLELIAIRKSINLWTNLEDLGMFKQILKYDIYTKLDSLDSKIKIYKKYKKNNDLISFNYIDYIRQVQAINEQIEVSYYNSYIDEWYNEWNSELNKDLTQKYKKKILLLNIELKKLVKKLDEYDA